MTDKKAINEKHEKVISDTENLESVDGLHSLREKEVVYQGKSDAYPSDMRFLRQMELMEQELGKLVELAKKNKNILHIDELNEQLPSEIMDARVLDKMMFTLEKQEIEIKYPLLGKRGQAREEDALFSTEEKDEEDVELSSYRNNDPVRLYLRKMGGVSLLDRAGEIDIACRIEKGEREIIRAILMCPMGTGEVIRLGDHLKRNRLKVKSIFRGLEDEDQSLQ